MAEESRKVIDYTPSEGAEEVIMPSRRCPHCRVMSSYDVGGENKHFDRKTGSRMRFDTCRNEECQASVAVVFDPQTSRELDIYPQLEAEPDELLPEDVKTAFRQALHSLNEGLWDGCVLMCRRALEEATFDLKAEGDVLYQRIEYLAEQNRITPDLRDWAHEGRLAGKLGAHGAEEEEKKWNEEVDAEEIVEFCKWFFRYVYVLPRQLQERKKRLAEEPTAEGEAQAAAGTQ